MIGALYFVYVARTPQAGDPPLVGVSHYPLLDLAVLAETGFEHLTVVRGPLPVALAEREAARLEARLGAIRTPSCRPRQRAGPGGPPGPPGESRALAMPGPQRASGVLAAPAASGGPNGLPPSTNESAQGPSRLHWWLSWRDVAALLRSRSTSFKKADSVTVRDCAGVDMPSDEDVGAILDVLEGRILFDHEIRRALEERGHPVAGPLEDALQVLILRGLVGREPSVATGRFGIAHCVRCGGRDIVEASCSSCGSEECLRCVECISMGEARSCRPLYYAPRRARAPGAGHAGAAAMGASAPGVSSGAVPRMATQASGGEPTQAAGGTVARVATGAPPEMATAASPGAPADSPDLRSDSAAAREITLPFELTKAQQDASRFVVSFVAEDERSECLVHAVCGAGKTEVCFGAIALALRRGGRVLFAVPRSDVVAEVAPRISAALAGARVVALRSGARERYRDADLVVATTHQVLRFYQAFDLVVLDEADAFPFRGSRMLRHALRRATGPGGKTVYMTATPDQPLVAAAERGRVALVRISARHHGHPLPVPVVIKVSLPPVEDHAAVSRLSRHPAEGVLPPGVVGAINASVRDGHGVFVFVPTVELASRVCAMLEASLARGCSTSCDVPPRVAFVHSGHPERDRLREAFKDGQIDVLVTTTIMERGITVPMADVVVLYADFERVFDAAALVQMAGRAGRSHEYPCASVYFVAERTSPAMRAAIECIQAMNRRAARSGYLVATASEGADGILLGAGDVGRDDRSGAGVGIPRCGAISRTCDNPADGKLQSTAVP